MTGWKMELELPAWKTVATVGWFRREWNWAWKTGTAVGRR